MKIVSVNISKPQHIEYNGRQELTGYFKNPVGHPVRLTPEGVSGDHVSDRQHHGGADKACYLYSVDHYDFWKQQYPDLPWNFGMFGENLSVAGLDESAVHIGDVLQAGTALLQVSQPRQPCYKLGLRFRDAGMIKNFRNAPYPGIYTRVLQEGQVKKGDEMVQTDRGSDFSIAEVFHLLYHGEDNPGRIGVLLENIWLPEKVKNYLRKKYMTHEE